MTNKSETKSDLSLNYVGYLKRSGRSCSIRGGEITEAPKGKDLCRMKVGAGISQIMKIAIDDMEDEECKEGKGNNGTGVGLNKCKNKGNNGNNGKGPGSNNDKGGNNGTDTAGGGTGKGSGMGSPTGGKDGQVYLGSKGKGASGNQGKRPSGGKGKGPNGKNGKGFKDMEDSKEEELNMYEMVFWQRDGQEISKVQYNELIGQWIKKPVAKCSCASDNMCPAYGGGKGKKGRRGGSGGGSKWGGEDNWMDDLVGSDSDSSSEEYGSDSDEYGSDSDGYGSDSKEYDSNSEEYGSDSDDSGSDEYGSDAYGSGEYGSGEYGYDEYSEEDGSGT
jgi:hypothetical protein